MAVQQRAYKRWGSFDAKKHLGESPLPTLGLRNKVGRTSISGISYENADDTIQDESTSEEHSSVGRPLPAELPAESPTFARRIKKPSLVNEWQPERVVPIRHQKPSEQEDRRGGNGDAQTRVGSRILRAVSMDGLRHSFKDGSHNSATQRATAREPTSTHSSIEDYSEVDLSQDSEESDVPQLELPDFAKKAVRLEDTKTVNALPPNMKVKEFKLLVPSIGGGPSKGEPDSVADQTTRGGRSSGGSALLYGCGTAPKASKPQANTSLSRKSSAASLSSSFSYSFAASSGGSSSNSTNSSYSSSPRSQWRSPTSTPSKGRAMAMHIMDLPDECITAVISCLHSIKDWLSCTRVCKRWALLANDGLSTLRLNDNVNYSGRGGVFTLLHRFPNLTFLEVPAFVCSNSFCANLKTSCPQLRTLVLASSPGPVPRTPGAKMEPQALPPAIGTLNSLRELRIQSDLVAGFPGSMGLLFDLEVFELDVCRRVKSLPESLGELKALKTLSLVEVRGLLAIPESIGLLSELRSLKISLCSNLTSLPASIGKLTALEYLEISNCERLTQLPATICRLTSLRTIKLVGFRVLQRLASSGQGEEIEKVGIDGHIFPHLRRLELGWSEGEFPLPIYRTAGVQSLTTSCQNVAVFPECFGLLSHLQVLEFRQCRDLAFLPPSVMELGSLEELRLLNCPALQALPENMGHWTSLRHLELSKCVQLAEIPRSIGKLCTLNSMIMKDAHRLEILPNSIGRLSGLQTLQLLHCPRLASLPYSFGLLSSLEVLEIWRCSSLLHLPESLGQLSALRKLRIINCQSLEGLPDDFGRLKKLALLEVVDCARLIELPDSFGRLGALDSLTLRLRGLECLPDSFGELSSLRSLVLAGVGDLVCLPSTFGYLTALKYLEIESADRLVTFPESFGRLHSLEFLKVQWCDSLMLLPESFGQLTSLTSFEITDCRRLSCLPSSMGGLVALETLRVRECASITVLPPSFPFLSSLQSLAIRGTPIAALPSSFGHLSALQHLSVHSAQLTTLPDSFGHLICLYDLRIEHCSKFVSLPRSFGGLISLHSLRLLGLPVLSELPPSFGHLGALREVEIQDSGLTSLECLGVLKALTRVDIKGCANLPESWGRMGRWMQRLPSTRLTITFSPPQLEKKGKDSSKNGVRLDRSAGDSDAQCVVM